MITSLHLRNFKRFESLDVSGFSRVNLITGKNNSGKTGLLEAIILACDQGVLERLATKFRLVTEHIPSTPENQLSSEYAQWFGKQSQNEWEIGIYSGPTQNGRAKSGVNRLRSTIFPSISWQSGVSTVGQYIPYVAIRSWPYSVSEDLAAYELMLRSDGAEQKLEDLLRVLAPQIKTIRSLPTKSNPSVNGQAPIRALYANVGLGEAIPLALLGNGVNRLSAIYSRTLGSKAKVVLIDEIENGLHHSALVELWEGLKELSEKEGAQIFATTHSMECIAAASAVFGSGADAGLSFHRIEDVKGIPTAISADATVLAGILEDGFEIR